MGLLEFLRGAERVAVVGVGSELRADDGAGVEVVRKLKKLLTSSRVLLVEAGPVPEHYLEELERFKPSHVLFVDAADFNASPGSVVLAKPESVVGRAISTHKLPLSLLASYLHEQLGARVALLGIQPKNVELGGGMSAEVKMAVVETARALSRVLGSLWSST